MSDNKLHTAVRYGNEEETLQALKLGFDPNEIGMLRWSPVHEAAHNGERDILKLLLLYNGDVNLKDGLHGNTPLHYAAQEDNSACATVLLNAGAKLDVENDLGKTPMDLAASSCLERMEPFVNNSQNTSSDNWPHKASTTTVSNGTEWDGVDDIPTNAAIGALHLSFEFHQNNLKVRVWQISDLLLPPPQTSMIESIFVRGYFIPDVAKKSQRKTENIPVDPTNKDTSRGNCPNHDGIQHIFTPSSFRFTTPLLYTGVTDDIVSQRSIQLEVCMTQKHTHKPFLMAMVHMPLRTAVRRPIREKYPLIPCMNYTIPNSMRVYSAKDIFVEGTSEIAPSLSRSNSTNSSSDIQFDDIRIDRLGERRISPKRKTIAVNMSISNSFDNVDDSHDNETHEECVNVNGEIDSDFPVKICSGNESILSSVAVEMSDSDDLNDEDESDETLKDVLVHTSERLPVDVVVDVDDGVTNQNEISHEQKKKKIIPNELFGKLSDDEDCDKSTKIDNIPVDESTVIAVEEEIKETVVDISQLQNDAVIDMEVMTDSGYDNESIKSESPGFEGSDATKRKKKIIPIEFVNSPALKSEKGGEGIQNLDYNVVDEDDDISCELDIHHRINSLSHNTETSESSKEIDSAPVTGSRPETPVWDFYDFTETTANTGVGEENDEQNTNADETTANSNCKTSADKSSKLLSSSTSTLQESLARLSRPKPVLDTCLVSGPVLPSVMIIDDFEMDGDD